MEHTIESVKQFYTDNNLVEVVFTKADGTERTLVGTRNFDLIPIDNHPKPIDPTKPVKEQKEPTTVTVFETESKQWRSFKPTSIISLKAV